MSGRLVGMVLRGTPSLKPAEKLVLVVHAEYTRANAGGISWPSVSTVAAETGLSQRRVKAIRRKLVALGYLMVVEKSRGAPKTTKYRLNLLRFAQAANGVADSTVKSRRTVSPTTPSDPQPAGGSDVADSTVKSRRTVSPTTPSDPQPAGGNGVADSTVKSRRTVSPTTPSDLQPVGGNGVAMNNNSVVASKDGAGHDTVTVLAMTPEPEVSRYITGNEPVTRARACARDGAISASDQKPSTEIFQPKTEAEIEAERQRQLALVRQHQRLANVTGAVTKTPK